MSIYDSINALSVVYGHCIDDRDYYMDGDTLVVNPIYNPVEAVMKHLQIDEEDIDMSRLEEIVNEKVYPKNT